VSAQQPAADDRSGVLPFLLTMGEPAGIGGEIALRAWTRRKVAALPPFVILDDPARLAALARSIGLDAPVYALDGPHDVPQAVETFSHALPVLPVPLVCPAVPGLPDPRNGACVLASIDQAVSLVMAGAARGIVTNPIQKNALYEQGFAWPGHTEYLAHCVGLAADEVCMMLAGGGLRVALVTIHLPLADVAGRLSIEGIVRAATLTERGLRQDFGLQAPRLAIAALNPHAGESGRMGREEIDIIAPAVRMLNERGITAQGPFPADTLFHAEARAMYDAVLCMYHDQGLIPLKTLDFYGGVNVTLGLPFVRSSPDHGAALALAGRGIARSDSLEAALRAANDMARHREAARAP
jgi:4-hydroxythreonine-4-phosphate dehydrogenase